MNTSFNYHIWLLLQIVRCLIVAGTYFQGRCLLTQGQLLVEMEFPVPKVKVQRVGHAQARNYIILLFSQQLDMGLLTQLLFSKEPLHVTHVISIYEDIECICTECGATEQNCGTTNPPAISERQITGRRIDLATELRNV